MSIFGGGVTQMNIYGEILNIQDSQETDILSLLLSLFDIIETIEDTIVDVLLPSDELGISPELAMKSVSLVGQYAPLLARRLYYKYGYENLANGTCDCRILRKLYEEHPILRLYSFEIAEPRCCE